MSPVEDEQGPLVGGPVVGDIYFVGTDFYFRMPDLRRLDKEVDELIQVFRRPGEHMHVHQKRSRFWKRLLRRHFR